MKRLIMVSILITILIISGCWNYKEVAQINLVAGVAIDYNKENVNEKYLVTVEVINVQADEAGLKGETISSTGETIFDCVRNLISKVGRKLFWGHSKVIIISQDVAQEGIIPVVDFIYRDAELRGDMWIFISEETTASEILTGENIDTNDLNSYHIDNVIKSQDALSKFYGLKLWNTVRDIYSEGKSPTMPLIKFCDICDTKEIVVGGTSVFREDKLIGFLDEEETKIFMLIIDELKGGLFLTGIAFKNEITTVTLEILNSKSTLKTKYINNNIEINIEIELRTAIAEFSGLTDFKEENAKKQLIKGAKQQLESEIINLVNKLQNDYESDIFGFGEIIKNKHPKLWKEFENSWDDNEFKKLVIKPNITLKIDNSALNSEPVKIAE